MLQQYCREDFRVINQCCRVSSSIMAKASSWAQNRVGFGFICQYNIQASSLKCADQRGERAGIDSGFHNIHGGFTTICGGINTASITWIMPLSACISVAVTVDRFTSRFHRERQADSSPLTICTAAGTGNSCSCIHLTADNMVGKNIAQGFYII